MTKPFASISSNDSAYCLAEPFTVYRELLDACRGSLRRDVANSPCSDHVLRYVVSGKMLRPLVTFMAASAVGGNPAEAIAGARAIELLHVASLVHDDIMDRALERRGLPSLHLQVGVDRAVVIGDYLLLRATNVLTEDVKRNSATTVRALTALCAYAERCCHGQVRELESAAAEASEREYTAIAESKTGAPFAAAASVGAILGSGCDKEIEALARYGTMIGVAFQISDDLRDLRFDAPSGETPRGLAFLRHDLNVHSIRRTQASFVALALAALNGLRPSEALEHLCQLPSCLL